MNKELEYWYENTSMLAFAMMIRNKLPWYIRPFVKVYADEKWLDNNCNVIRIYYSYKSYADVKIKDRFCYEFKLEDLNEMAASDKTISSQTVKKYNKKHKNYKKFDDDYRTSRTDYRTTGTYKDYSL